MPTAQMPGRRTVDFRNCYLTDEEIKQRDEAFAKWEAVESEHNYPAMVWWAVVAIAAVGSFAAGCLMGAGS